MSEVTDDHAPLNAAVDAIEPRRRAHLLRRTVAVAALDRAVAEAAARASHLYSDMQQTGMPANFNDLRLNAERTPRAAPDRRQGDRATSRWKTWWRRAACTTRKKTRVLVTVAGYGNTEGDAHRVARCSTGAPSRPSRSKCRRTAAPPWSSCRSTCRTAATRAKCSIDSADTLPADDSFYFSVERADPRHALFVQESDEHAAALLYFKAALEAAGQSAFEIDPVTVDQVANI